MTTTLVLGGARSGKSSYAQRAAEAAAAHNGGQLILIATAEASDAEMRVRIARHQEERGSAWLTVEAPMALPEALSHLQENDVAVVDCLTLWVNNLLLHDADVETQVDALVTAVAEHRGLLWLVSNEVGGGIVPDNALARKFRDECGRLHQRLAAVADKAVLLVAGLPLTLK
jgi:adenosylcobinamide kinase/adenosylcobinamide-phosphate guanylyltransferase